MREILFRGKRIANGEWYYGSYLFLHKSPVDWTGAERGKPEDVHYIINDQDINYAVDPSTVGQYTGLTDKNGKRIFEGDIVEYNDGYDYFKGMVVFENGAFGIGSYEVIGLSSGCCDNFASLWQLFWDQEVTDEPELYFCSVIGNIHDNPELLKEAES